MATAELSLKLQASSGSKIKDFINANLINILAALLFLLLAFFLLYPIIAVLLKSFRGPSGFTLKYYQAFFSKNYYFQSLYNTLLLGVINTVVCLVIGFCLAYMTTRGPWILRKPLKIIALVPLIAPPYLFALSLIILFGRNGLVTRMFDLHWQLYGFGGVVISQTLAFIPLAYMMIESTLMSLNPNLEESAYDMGGVGGDDPPDDHDSASGAGASQGGALDLRDDDRRVRQRRHPGRADAIPGAGHLHDDHRESDFNMGSVLSVVLIAPCILIFFIHNYLLEGKTFTTIGGKPVASEPRKITPLIKVPFVIITTVAAGAIFICFAVVFAASFYKILGVTNKFILTNYLDFTSNQAIYNSIRVSLRGGRHRRDHRRSSGLRHRAGEILRPHLHRDGLPLRLCPSRDGSRHRLSACLQRPAPQADRRDHDPGPELRLPFSGRRRRGGDQQASSDPYRDRRGLSADLGASFLTTFSRIVLPIMFPAFIAGFIYTFMTAIVSLSAVVFLVSPGFELAAVKIFDAAVYGEIGIASATTMKLVLIVTICMMILNYVSNKNPTGQRHRKETSMKKKGGRRIYGQQRE